MVGCFPQFNHQTVKGERRVGIPLLTEVVLKKLPAQNCSYTNPQIWVKSTNRNAEYLVRLGCYPRETRDRSLHGLGMVFVITINICIMFLLE